MLIFEKTVQELSEYLPRVVAAVVVLVLGWLLAWLIFVVVLKSLHRLKLDERMSRGIGEKYETEHWIARGVFWLIMLFAVITFFSVLKLPPVSESLKNVLDEVLGYLPRLLAAGVILLVAWTLAGGLRLVILRALAAAEFDERFDKQTAISEVARVPLSKTLANTGYWLIFLLFLPAVLSVLAIEGILMPVEQMVEKIVAFLPNILVAGLILLGGWLLARIVRRIVTNVLVALGADRLTEKMGLKQNQEAFSLSRVFGLVVYILIFIPIVIAALGAIKLESITRPASDMLGKMLGALPLVFAAVVLLVIAYMVGRLVGRLAANLLGAVNFDSLPPKLGLGKDVVTGKWAPSEIVGHLIVVTVMLFAFVSACNVLGFNALATLFSEFLVLVGHIVVGLVIFVFGLYLANLAADIIRSRLIAQAELLSIVARVTILLLAGAMALRQMGLANEIISLAFGLAFGAVAVAAAIAFGIGGRDIAARKLNEWTKLVESRKPKMM